MLISRVPAEHHPACSGLVRRTWHPVVTAIVLLVLLVGTRERSVAGPREPRWSTAGLLRAIERTIALGDPVDLALFFEAAAVREMKRGRRLENLHWKESNWREVIAGSEKHPEAIWLNGDGLLVSDVGMSLYRGDIFANGYFARTGKPRPGTTATLTTGQPWLRYVAAEGRFVVQRSGAQELLLSRVGEESTHGFVRLYRGMTRPFDVALWKVTRELHGAEALPAKRRVVLATRLRQAVRDWERSPEGALPGSGRTALMQLADRLEGALSTRALGAQIARAITDANREAKRDAVFTTTSEEKTRVWGRHGVIAVDLSVSKLAALSRNREVYIGIEGEVEIAFISRRAQELLMTRWSLVHGPSSAR